MHTSVREFLRVSLALSFAHLACAAGAVAQTTATLVETVTDDVTGAPLGSAGSLTFTLRVYSPSGVAVGSAATNASGQYAVTGIIRRSAEGIVDWRLNRSIGNRRLNCPIGI